MSFTLTPEEQQAELDEAAAAAEVERLRHQTRWWHTHDAILGGLYACSHREIVDLSQATFRAIAKKEADEIHGPLFPEDE